MNHKPCCTALRHLSPETIAALDADLIAGGPSNSVRKVADRYGLNRTTVSDHRECLGLRVGTGKGLFGRPAVSGPDTTGHPEPPEPETSDSAQTSVRTVSDSRARSVLERAEILERRASRFLKRIERGEEGIDFKAGASLFGQIRGLLDLQARVHGLLKAPEAVSKPEPADSGERRFIVEIAEPIRPCPPQPSSDPQSGDSSPPTDDPGTG